MPTRKDYITYYHANYNTAANVYFQQFLHDIYYWDACFISLLPDVIDDRIIYRRATSFILNTSLIFAIISNLISISPPII